MKNKYLTIVLLTTTILSALAAVLKFSFSEVFGSIICFPFEQIGIGLRWLSLQGGLQNMIALAIYFIISLSPLLPLLLRLKKKTAKAEDGLFALLSLLLFYVIYMMINPALIPLPQAVGLGGTMAKALLCSAIYSVIVTYFVLTAIRLFFTSETAKLHNYMVALLSATAMLFTFSVFGVGLNETLTQISSIKAANIGNESGLAPTNLFVAIKFAIDSMASVVSVLVIYSSITFINQLSADPYSEHTALASEKLLGICKNGLIVTVCSSTAFNLLQLLFMGILRNINTAIEIPLFSILFVLGALILSKMVMANKRLKDDNDSII